jgi:hypothetical protein
MPKKSQINESNDIGYEPIKEVDNVQISDVGGRWGRIQGCKKCINGLDTTFFLDKCYLKNNPKPHTCYTCKYYKLSMLSPLSVKNANNTQVLQVSLL